MNGRFFLIAAGALGALGVTAGAFGAHYLQGLLENGTLQPRDLETFEIAVRYQMYHALALGLTGLLCLYAPSRAAKLAGGLFLAGTFMFCGLLYLLVLTGTKWLGAVVPLGGLAFIGGWIALVAAALKAGRDSGK